MKTETIEITVPVRIEYDETREGAREHVVEQATRELRRSTDVSGWGEFAAYAYKAIPEELQ